MAVRITSFLKSLSRLLSLLPGHLLRAADVHLKTAQLARSLQAVLTQLSRVQPTIPQPNQSLDFNNENTRLYFTERLSEISRDRQIHVTAHSKVIDCGYCIHKGSQRGIFKLNYHSVLVHSTVSIKLVKIYGLGVLVLKYVEMKKMSEEGGGGGLSVVSWTVFCFTFRFQHLVFETLVSVVTLFHTAEH